MVAATATHPRRGRAREASQRAALEAAREAAQHPRAAAELYAHAVPARVAPLPEGKPSRPEPRAESRGAPPVRRGGRALAALVHRPGLGGGRGVLPLPLPPPPHGPGVRGPPRDPPAPPPVRVPPAPPTP